MSYEKLNRLSTGTECIEKKHARASLSAEKPLDGNKYP